MALGATVGQPLANSRSYPSTRAGIGSQDGFTSRLRWWFDQAAQCKGGQLMGHLGYRCGALQPALAVPDRGPVERAEKRLRGELDRQVDEHTLANACVYDFGNLCRRQLF